MLRRPKHSKNEVVAPKEEEEEEEEEERLGTHCTGGWVGPTAGLDRCGKSRPPPGFDPRTVQPVASRYTDYATRTTCVVYEQTLMLTI